MNENAPGAGLSRLERAALNALLVCEREETSRRLAGLIGDLDAIIESSALSVADDEHDPEGATLGFERAQLAALVDEARRHLDAVDEAMERARVGTYGVCERCGRPIGVDRMVAVPVAVTCVDCAADAGGGPFRSGRA